MPNQSLGSALVVQWQSLALSTLHWSGCYRENQVALRWPSGACVKPRISGFYHRAGRGKAFIVSSNPRANSSQHACQCARLCPTLCHPVDCSLAGSSVHGILQASILEWVAIPFSRGSSRPRGRTHVSCVSCIGRWILHHCTIWEAHFSLLRDKKPVCLLGDPQKPSLINQNPTQTFLSS